jgi:Skp family chaperone for outer membrane proteins
MTTKTLRSLLILCILLFSACAKRPENIAAVNLSTINYSHYTCLRIDANVKIQKNTLKKLSEKQNSKANIDAWLLILSIIPMSTITGEYEKEISKIKGKIQTFTELKNNKNCL